MDIPNSGELPDDATVIFYVSGGKRFPRTGPCEYIDAEGLKCDEDGISVTCVELCPGAGEEQFVNAALAMRGTMKVRKSGVVARVSAGTLMQADEGGAEPIRIVPDPLDDNPAHCLIKGVAADDMGRRLALARAVSDFVPASDIPDFVND